MAFFYLLHFSFPFYLLFFYLFLFILSHSFVLAHFLSYFCSTFFFIFIISFPPTLFFSLSTPHPSSLSHFNIHFPIFLSFGSVLPLFFALPLKNLAPPFTLTTADATVIYSKNYRVETSLEMGLWRITFDHKSHQFDSNKQFSRQFHLAQVPHVADRRMNSVRVKSTNQLQPVLLIPDA